MSNDQLSTIVRGQPNESPLCDLLVDSDSEPKSYLKEFTNRFAESCKGLYEVVSFYETKKSPTVKVCFLSCLRWNELTCLDWR